MPRFFHFTNNVNVNVMNIFKKFNSIHELDTYLKDNPVTELFKHHQHGIKEGDIDFTKTNTFEEANNLMLYGDKEMAAKVRVSLDEKLRKLKRTKNRRVIYSSPVGFAPNVPAYICGSPNSMVAAKQQKQKQKIVTIVYNCTAPFYIKANDLITAASNVMAAIVLLEDLDIKVNLYVTLLTKSSMTAKQRYDTIGLLLRLKKADQKLDILRVAYPMIHPSFLRRHSFRFIEVTPNVGKDFVGNYGFCVKDEYEISKVLTENNLKFDCVFDYTAKSKKPEGIVKMILNG